MANTFTQIIRSKYNQFNATDKKIADFLLSLKQNRVDLTIQNIAFNSKTSTASVSRFAKKIGFDSFRDLSIEIATNSTKPTSNFFAEIENDDNVKQIQEKVFNAGIGALQSTNQTLSSLLLKQASEWIKQSSKVGFFGVGGSAVVAYEAYHKFLRTPINVFSHPDFDIQLMEAAKMTAKSLGIVISHSGRNKDMILLSEKLKERGSKIIVITSFAESQLAQIADIVLQSSADEINFRTESMSSLIAQITIMDTLFTSVGVDPKNQTQKIVDTMRETIEETRSK